MAFRLSVSLGSLRDEVNTRFPGRDKASAGWIGAARHPATSDHKPWVKDNRGAYVISNRRIASATSGWDWRHYSDSNPHLSHTHVSVSLDQSGYDACQPWGLGDAPPPDPGRPTCKKAPSVRRSKNSNRY